MKPSAFPLVCGLRGRVREVADAECAAGDGVCDRDVGGAVVGEDPLDADAVPGKEGRVRAGGSRLWLWPSRG